METAYELKDEKIKITKYNKNSYAIDFEKGKFVLWISRKELMELRDRVSEALDPPEEDEGFDVLREAEDYRKEVSRGEPK